MTTSDKNPTHPEAIGQRLIAVREALDLTQTEFARSISVAKNTYNQYEKGKGRPSIESTFLMWKTHKITFDWVYMGDPSGLPQRIYSKLKSE